MTYFCYLIYSPSTNNTYIGITNNLDKRCDQHNSIISGGAKATKKNNDWVFHTYVGFFDNKSSAMRFEWLWKHYKINNKWTHTKGLKMRLNRLNELLSLDEWSEIIILYSKN